MGNDEKILEILGSINDRLSKLESDMSEIKETLSEHTEILSDHTTALNELIEWTDAAQVEVRIPFGKVK